MGNAQGMQLSDYISVLRRRKWLIALAALVVTGTAILASSLQTPVYQAPARILIQPPQTAFNSSGVAQSVGATGVETELQVIQSEPVRQAVMKKLGVAPDISVAAIGQTTVVEIRADSTSPARAAAIANAYADAYMTYKRQQAVDNLAAIGQELQSKIDALQKQIDDLGNQILALPPCTANDNNSAACAQHDSLQKDRDAKITQQEPFKERLDQLQVDMSLNNNAGPQLVSSAVPPTTPIRPRPVRNALMGLGAGLIFGVALAFALEHLDDSINSKDDFERLGVDLPVLGIIPLTSGGRKGEPYVVARADSTSPAAEAYRTLRTSIQFAAVNRTLRTLQITSPSASEGKTTTAANLGVTFARANKKVVVVSCDLRRPRVHHFFGVSNNRGFTTVLLNEASPRAVLQPVRDEKGLYVVGSGPIPHNPSELLSSAKTAEVFSELASDAEMVIVDCPPVLPVTDAAVLASRMDATLLVVTMGSTTRKQLSRTLEILRQVKAPIIGAVLNGVTAESDYPEYYYRYEPSTNGNGTNGKKRERTADEVAREQY